MMNKIREYNDISTILPNNAEFVTKIFQFSTYEYGPPDTRHQSEYSSLRQNLTNTYKCYIFIPTPRIPFLKRYMNK